MKMNVKASLSVLNLCTETVNLKLFVYVSTAFSGSCSKRIEEVTSRPQADPLELLALMKEQDVDTFDGVTFEKVKGNHPNSYTLTKQLSEAMVNDFSRANGIRTVIAKPGIIMPPIREPCAYYVENLSQGTQAVGASLGAAVTTVVPGKVTNAFAGIPVDTCANTLLVSAADAAHKWQSEPSHVGEVIVYGLYNTTDNIIRNEHAFHVTCRSAQTYPTLKAVRPPVLCSFTEYPVIYTIQLWLFELVFAFFFDLTLMMAGKPAKMFKIMRKAHKTMGVLAYFVSIDWRISGQNTANAFAKLSDEEKRIFDCDLSHVDWNDYFEKFWLGIRKWIFREDLDNLPEARTRLRRYVPDLNLLLLPKSPINDHFSTFTGFRLKLTYYSACTLLTVMVILILFSAANWCALTISALRQHNPIPNSFNSA